MTQESIVETIYDIQKQLKQLNKKIDNLQLDVNLLNDKANGKIIEALQDKIPSGKIEKPGASIKPPARKEQPEKKLKGSVQPRKNAKVSGKIVNSDDKAMVDVSVTIFDSKGNKVKQTTSNRAGRWMSFLPPGKYSAEYSKIGMASWYKVFEIKPGITEHEVI